MCYRTHAALIAAFVDRTCKDGACGRLNRQGKPGLFVRRTDCTITLYSQGNTYVLGMWAQLPWGEWALAINDDTGPTASTSTHRRLLKQCALEHTTLSVPLLMWPLPPRMLDLTCLSAAQMAGHEGVMTWLVVCDRLYRNAAAAVREAQDYMKRRRSKTLYWQHEADRWQYVRDNVLMLSARLETYRKRLYNVEG